MVIKTNPFIWGKQLGFEVVPCYKVRMKIAGLLIKIKLKSVSD